MHQTSVEPLEANAVLNYLVVVDLFDDDAEPVVLLKRRGHPRARRGTAAFTLSTLSPVSTILSLHHQAVVGLANTHVKGNIEGIKSAEMKEKGLRSF
jgi:hypothetical protein